ncbi:dihydrolipoamide dehydrogenase [Roseovarius pacificus]|uniref:Dihydrolipoyl dehydrogenase n=1 Tax=Roseovarius pacificus TaxID=337701 RepID=A0A1M7KLT5_9RHOB|nr:dihydrolipoyl dehydrogenase [Roseovarius pacificus]GGO63047.1 dihydrolipoyl dehydrogenase [Roseovarius pacificus]SHM66357.1 dihydrolipoamide dehydrogenase [Roseovarius pacificus]
MTVQVKVPDTGNASDVTVAEITVAIGDMVAATDDVVLLESDKAVMDIPAEAAGRVVSIDVAIGDVVTAGQSLMTLEAAEAQAAPKTLPDPATTTAEGTAQLVVLGGGPGGYTAAFRAADLGLDVTLIDSRPTLGGVCLNVGCIPSKALLHLAKIIDEAKHAGEAGLTFGAPKIDLDGIRAFRDKTTGRLTSGLAGLAKRRKVRVVTGQGAFTGPNDIEVRGPEGTQTILFQYAIIACGSEPVRLPFLPEDPRIMDSTGALALEDIPERLLIIGGGIIGLEMAEVYHALGSRITVVETMDKIIPGADADITRPLHKRIAARYEEVMLKTKVTGATATEAGIEVSFETGDTTRTEVFDRVLVATGRRPNGGAIKAEAAGITPDARGFISVDTQMRTAQPHIFAVGDVVGQPMLAHKAAHEGKVAAEVIAGEKAAFDPLAIPSVAYTDPEIAWAGLTETDAKAKGIAYEKGVFPWAASGRSLSMGRDDGLTKILIDPETKRIIGGAMTGPNAGELLAEIVVAIEIGAVAEDLALSIHPHPTLSETVAFSADAYLGTLTDG